MAWRGCVGAWCLTVGQATSSTSASGRRVLHGASSSHSSPCLVMCSAPSASFIPRRGRTGGSQHINHQVFAHCRAYGPHRSPRGAKETRQSVSRIAGCLTGAACSRRSLGRTRQTFIGHAGRELRCIVLLRFSHDGACSRRLSEPVRRGHGSQWFTAMRIARIRAVSAHDAHVQLGTTDRRTCILRMDWP